MNWKFWEKKEKEEEQKPKGIVKEWADAIVFAHDHGAPSVGLKERDRTVSAHVGQTRTWCQETGASATQCPRQT